MPRSARSSAPVVPAWLSDALSLPGADRGQLIAIVTGPHTHSLLGERVLISEGGATNGLADDDPRGLWHQAISAVSTDRGAQTFQLPVASAPDQRPVPADVFLAWLAPVPEAWIFGAGHIGAALCPILTALGWRVVVCDDRREFAMTERFPHAAECRVSSFALSARECAGRADAWAVLVTRGHQHDLTILSEWTKQHPRYIGMIGSRRRVETVRKNLKESDAPESLLDVLHAPIGLPIGAETPAEIAVSIASEMVALRRGAGPRRDPDARRALPADTVGWQEIWQTAAAALKSGQHVVLATIIGRRGSTPRSLGAQMAVFPDGRMTGTIGGGCGEGIVLDAARDLILRGGPPHTIEIDLTGDAASETSDICGGRYTVFIQRLPS